MNKDKEILGKQIIFWLFVPLMLILCIFSAIMEGYFAFGNELFDYPKRVYRKFIYESDSSG